MPFVPLASEPTPRRGFVPLDEPLEPEEPRRGFTPLARAAPIVPASSSPAPSPPGTASDDVAARPAFSFGSRLEPGNIDLYNRPHVRNPDGRISTVRSASFNVEGQEVLVPTVSDDGRLLSNEEALDQYLQTGKHLGKFSTPAAATAYAQQLHEDYAAGRYDKRLPEASALEPGWWERLAGGFQAHEGLSQNLGDLLVDRIPQIDPATGQRLTPEERRRERLRVEQRRSDALGLDDAQTLGAMSADVLGAILKEATDPLAIMTGGIGAGAKGLARLAQLAAAGGAYEGVSATAEQLSDAGEVTSPLAVAGRAVAGATLTPAFDVALRGLGTGIRRLLALRRQPGAKTDVVDDQIRAGMRAAAEEADTAGVPREQAVQRLIEIVQTPEGDVGVPRRDVFELPAPEGVEGAAPKRGFTPVTDATSATAPAAPPVVDAIEAAGRRRAHMAELADEYDRLARATTDPVVRTELLNKAAFARGEAAGTPKKLTPQERMDRARRVDPTRDTLDVAIRKMGGLDTELENDWTGRLLDVPRIFGLPALERPGKGKSLDALAERLWELDYLQNYDQSELAALLDRVERGEKVYSLAAPGEARGVEREPARHTDRDFTLETEGVEPQGIERDFVIDTDAGTVVPARPIDLADLRRLEEDEANATAWFERESAEQTSAGRAEQPGGFRAPGRDGVPERVEVPPAGRAGDQPGTRAARDLGSYDAAELRAELERRADVAAAETARRSAATIGRGPAARDTLMREAGPLDYTVSADERVSTNVREPESTGPRSPVPRRGGDAVPAQLELFVREGDDPTEGVAALEAFGPRVRYITTARFAAGTRQVTSAADVAHVTAFLRKEPQEALLAVVTDDAGHVLRIVRHSIGTRDSASADPGLVAAAAHSTPGGRQVWLVHQHPSGHAEQSAADARITSTVHELLRDTGVTPRGMVVVAPGGRFTHVDPDPAVPGVATPVPIPAAARHESLPVVERRFRRSVSDGAEVTDVAGLRAAMEKIAVGREGILLLDTRHKPVGFLPMVSSDMVKLRQGDGSPAGRLMQALDETNASATAAVIESPDEALLYRVHGNLLGFAQQAAIRHLDSLNADGVSAAERGVVYTPATFYANPFDQAVRLGGRTLRNNAAGAVPGGLAGGMTAGAASDEELGSARWWTDVGFGAAAGALGSATFFGALRGARITGKGGIADRGVAVAGRALGKLLGRGPAELEAMKQQQRLMRELLDRQTGEIGAFLRDQFKPSERALMADLIEGRGIVPDLNRVHTQAKALDDYLSFVTQRMKAYGMLPPGIEEGGYLHRYYAKHLGLDKAFQEAKRQSLSGSYTIARGMVDTFGREYLSPGASAITDEVESLLAEKSLLERGLFERAGKLRGARDVDSGRVSTLPDDAVLRAPPGRASGQPEPEISIDDAVRRTADIDERLAELRKVELVEMVGEQNGKVRAFFFARDEVGRVESGVDPVMARLFKRAQSSPAPPAAGGAPRLEAPLLQPSPGRVSGKDPSAAPPDVAAAGPPRIEELSPTDRLWTVKTTGKDGVQLRRDWTRRERDAWGEIRDAGYRFTRGMAEASHDLSLGKLFHDVARRREWVSGEPQVTTQGVWVQVPKGKARPGAGIERYGALSGKWVRPDVWRAMKRHGASPRVLGALGDVRVPLTGATVQDAYRAALNRWKLWHTVYNPVSHVNNTYSNVEMLYMGGYGPADLAHGIAELGRGENSALWREARDAGLLDTDFGTATLQEGGIGSPLEQLAEQLRNQREDTDASFAVDAVTRMKEWWINTKNAVESAESRWASGAEVAKAVARPLAKGFRFIKKPVDVAATSMKKLYRLEDNVFKLAVFAAERRAGKSVEQARQAAQELFFDYSDLPDAIKFVRDFPVGAPFISYTYKAIPAIARNIARNPERVLGLIMAYEAVNFANLVGAGMDPDQYLETMDAYDATLPPWDSGRSLWGARNFVILPGAQNLLAMGRMHAVGNPFMADAGERRLAVPGATAFWGSDVLGGNPLHAIYDAWANEDWRGKPIYDEGAPLGTKRKAVAAYLYQSWAPSNIATPGSYHQTKVLEGLANDARKAPDGVAGAIVHAANGMAEALGLQQFTGLDRMGEEIDSGDALLGTVGVKKRAIRTDKSVEIQSSQIQREIQDSRAHLKKEVRKRNQDRITDDQFEEERAKVQAEIEQLRMERDELQHARKILKEGGLLDRQRDQSSAVDDVLEQHRQLAQETRDLVKTLAPPARKKLTAPVDLEVASRAADGRATQFRVQGLQPGGAAVQIEITGRDRDGRASTFRTAGLGTPGEDDFSVEITRRDSAGRGSRFRVTPQRTAA